MVAPSKYFKSLTLISFIYFISFPLSATTAEFTYGSNAWKYKIESIKGWKVYIATDLSTEEKLNEDLNTLLNEKLGQLIKILPKFPLSFLKQIPIWISNEPNYPLLRPGEKGVVPFHRSSEWLKNNGLNPAMAPGVHIINPKAVLYYNKHFEWGPYTLLHELAHAYHNLVLGLEYKDILRAYKSAMAKNLYLNIPTRSDKSNTGKAYAATNVEEYFAELTEAYFGLNDFFPYDKAELQKYDPLGYRAIENAWGLKKGK